jgi:DNA-binding SARP family transcriptional activator/Flp pilus assembly protein TadD
MDARTSLSAERMELRTFGAISLGEVTQGDVRSLLAQPKRMGLLAWLILARPRGLHPRSTLLALFWPEHDQQHARWAANQAIRAIRSAIGPTLVLTRGRHEVGIAPEGLSCDALEFEAAIERHEWQRSLSLYRGDFLDGFHLSGCMAFERWQAAERMRFQGAATRAAWNLADADEVDGHLESAMGWARKAIAFSPHDEKGVRRLILLLDRAGERAGAVDAYEAYAQLLREELEVDPDPETQALAAQLRVRTQRAPQPTGSVRSMSAPVLEQSKPGMNAGETGERPSRRAHPHTVIALAGAAAALIAVGATHVMWRESFAAPDNPRRAAVATEAHSAWLRARHHLQKRRMQDLEACIRHADDAIRHDPRFASGHAVRGACFINTPFLSNVAPAIAFSEVRASTRRALALDPQHPGAQVNLAWVLAAAEWAWADGERHFLRALRLSPGFDYARADYGYFLSWLERHEEAIIEAREALRLSPTVPVMSQNLAHVLYLARRYEDALEQAEYGIALDSGFYLSYQRLGQAYAGLNVLDQAVLAFEKGVALAPDYARLKGWLGYAYARSGRADDARRILDELLALERATYVAPTAIAMIHLGLGDFAQALTWVERGFAERDAELVLLQASPAWDPLRTNPKFLGIIERMKWPRQR